jgi:hypothetical protein
MPTYDSDQIAAVTANGGFSLGENEATVKTAVFTSEATAADTVLNAARLPGGSKVLFVAVNAEASTTTTLTFSADGDTIGAALDSTGAIVNVTTGIGAASVAVGQDGLVIGTFNTGVTGTPEVNGTVYYIDGEDN